MKYRARIEQERLEKNKERRKKREKQKKLQQKMRDGGTAGDDGSPEPSTEKVTGTTRKCANCGQVGHIKTNKKYVLPQSVHLTPALLLTLNFERLCPLLNGSQPRNQNPDDTASFGSTNAPVAASFVNLG